MSIWAKMMTALRGGVNEAGEAIVDTQALRILDQEVREASEELHESKGSLAEIMAHQKLAEEKCKDYSRQIEQFEGYALKALEKGDEPLAREVAEKIADIENQLKQEKDVETGYAASANKLRQAIKQAERNIKRLKQQVDTVKATENVQRAQVAVADRYSGSQSKMRTAMDSLERIKEKQALKEAQLSAASELAEDASGDSLQEKLDEAGITSTTRNADDILARIKGGKASG
ncbi:phage shock protein A (PspA) family protein [Sinobacterium caligoides]|uniref:Phage shock protein A (PspA) family protein n=1 Tax=Sinobacterium caligoides TaxID=933926 RepID=A0A3N2DQ41_9GAMM|nr:PspA/IM30 family protein [Sinobacterium caligoides]ROS01802.1 phage shock protein A (PspA) family protein [Sinobacterium caligoides]